MVRLPREGEEELRRVLRLPELLRFERLPLRVLLGVLEGRAVTVPLFPPPKFGRDAVLPPFPGLLCDPPPTLPCVVSPAALSLELRRSMAFLALASRESCAIFFT